MIRANFLIAVYQIAFLIKNRAAVFIRFLFTCYSSKGLRKLAKINVISRTNAPINTGSMLSLTNFEVKKMFWKMIGNWFDGNTSALSSQKLVRTL